MIPRNHPDHRSLCSPGAALRDFACLFLLLPFAIPGAGQEKSVNPGINDSFKNPDLPAYLKKFEIESREVYAHREEIVKALNLKPGAAVGDIGAGTGIFTRLFARQVGPKGKVYAVDIAEPFLKHIKATALEEKLANIQTIRCDQFSTKLPANSIDLAFICDTYHHFEHPYRTLESIHQALKPGGQMVVIDFHRIPGKSTKWILGHVRAGQDVFVGEILASGFKQVQEIDLLKDNYFLRFEKAARKEK